MARKPLRDGWQVLKRAPESVLAEIVWRWTFGTTTLVLLFLSFHAYFSSIEISRAEYETLKALEPFTWIAIMVRVMHATMMGLRTMGPVLIPALVLLWVALATVGRVVTVRALSAPALSGDESRANWWAMIGLNSFRVAIALASVVAYFGAGV